MGVRGAAPQPKQSSPLTPDPSPSEGRGEKSVKRIVAVGTVCERKGQHTLVEAAAELAKTRSDFAVYLVGVRDAIPYAGYVRRLVQRRALEGVVHLIPETDDPFAFLRAADVFVCTSHLETFSRAVLVHNARASGEMS